LSIVRLLVERLAVREGWLAGAALTLAAFNLAFRIGNEMVQVWDESLFAITAQEMVESGRWIATTFRGTLDYYNSKPPLHLWLVALSFKAFDPGLVSLRLPSIVAAWGLAWHSYQLLDLNRSAQEPVPVAAAGDCRPRRLRHDVAARRSLRGADGWWELSHRRERRCVPSHADDLWLGPPDGDARLVPLATTGRQTLYRRRP
jgi:hypothetical protein